MLLIQHGMTLVEYLNHFKHLFNSFSFHCFFSIFSIGVLFVTFSKIVGVLFIYIARNFGDSRNLFSLFSTWSH